MIKTRERKTHAKQLSGLRKLKTEQIKAKNWKGLNKVLVVELIDGYLGIEASK